MVLDLDTTDDEIHGGQQGRFFHGYYGSYCYLPLYVFSGEHLLCARLRQSNVGPAEGTVQELERIVTQIREQWPEVKIVIRADSAFSRDDIMSWCEAHGVDYVLVLLVGRRNIASGVTSINRLDGQPLGHFTLTDPFDSALVDDTRVAHGVTPVEAIDPALPAYRDVLVVTFRREG